MFAGLGAALRGMTSTQISLEGRHRAAAVSFHPPVNVVALPTAVVPACCSGLRAFLGNTFKPIHS